MSAFWWYSSCILIAFSLQSGTSCKPHIFASVFVSDLCLRSVHLTSLSDSREKYGGKSWALRALQSNTSGSKSEKTIEDPVSLPDFVAGVCRTVNGMASVTILFDVGMSVPDFGLLIRWRMLLPTVTQLHFQTLSVLLVIFQTDAPWVWWSAKWKIAICKS